MKYRSDIDGLRAVSIIAVLLFHAGYITGGYIGVDVFFVISGFLITKILLGHISDNGKINFVDFYERRIKRIVPNLLLVVLFSQIAAIYFFSPIVLIEFSWQSISSIFFFSNIYFYLFSDIKYGQGISNEPLLHTWSLGIEEQFYILLPILILLLYRVYKKDYLKYLVYFVLLTLSGYVFSLLIGENHPVFNFYLIFTRYWELFIGSILAILSNEVTQKNKASVLVYFGLSLVIFSMIYFDSSDSHPNMYTLVPLLGTALIIRYGHIQDTLVGNFLTTKIMTYVGLISYSLYLWHYPIFTFLEIEKKSLFFQILIIIFVFLISSLNYHLFENIMRRRDNTRKFFYTILAILLTLNLSIAFSTISARGFPDSWKIEGQNFDGISYIDKWNKATQLEMSLDPFPKNSNKNILFVGNSVNLDLYRAFKTGDESEKYNHKVIKEQVRCLRSHIQNKYLENCDNRFNAPKKYHSNYLSLIRDADTIVFGTAWDDKDYIELEKLIPILQKDNKQIVLVTSPKMKKVSLYKNNFSPYQDFLKEKGYIPSNEELLTLGEESKKFFLEDDLNKKNRFVLRNIANKYNLQIIDKVDIFCGNEELVCSLIDYDDNQLFWDNQHLTNEGVLYFSPKVFDLISKEIEQHN